MFFDLFTTVIGMPVAAVLVVDESHLIDLILSGTLTALGPAAISRIRTTDWSALFGAEPQGLVTRRCDTGRCRHQADVKCADCSTAYCGACADLLLADLGDKRVCPRCTKREGVILMRQWDQEAA